MEATIPLIAVLALTMLAAYTDTRYGLVPNALTFPAMLAGIGWNVYLGGWSGLTLSLLGFGLGIALYLIPFVLGSMGGGDVKLLAAIGAMLGPSMVLNIFIYSAIFGGLVAVMLVTRQLGWSTVDLMRGASWRSFLLYRNGTSVIGGFPYATSILVGVVVAFAVR